MRLYDEEEALIEMPTIAAACWGPGRPPTTFVLVDHTGAVRETLALAHFSGDLRPRRRADELEYSLFRDPVKVCFWVCVWVCVLVCFWVTWWTVGAVM